MSKHLPEYTADSPFIPAHLPECPGVTCLSDPPCNRCICDRLRACEARVAAETVARLAQWQEAPREGFQW